MSIRLALLLFLVVLGGSATLAGTESEKVVPRDSLEKAQREFVENRFGMFICYNIMSYGARWGQAHHDIACFNPEQLDCRQWAEAAASAGMSYGLLTTKHHEGFCLWDSETTKYDVAATPYRKDVVKQFVEAFRQKKLGVGLYYSMWDSTHGIERGKMNAEKVKFVEQQLKELLTNYGKIDFLFFDGWYWRMGHRELDFTRLRELIRTLQPDCLVADNTHLQGYYHNDYVMFEGPFGAYPPKNNTMASAICDKIVGGNGWFWGPKSPNSRCTNPQKTAEKLKDLESRYCSFMLACLPNRRGLLDDNQIACLREIGKQWRPDEKRESLPAQEKRVVYSLSPAGVEASSGDGHLAFDGLMRGKNYTRWITSDEYPQRITMDLGAVYTGLEALMCVPAHRMKPERSIKEGNVIRFEISLSRDGKSFRKVTEGTWKPDARSRTAVFDRTDARYVRLTILEANGGAELEEIDIGAFSGMPKRLPEE
jgi:alpha-L-fucosidase